MFFLPEGPGAQSMTKTGYHQTELVSLRGRARPVLQEVVHHLPRQVHHAHAVLPPGVLGSGGHIVGAAKLSQTSQPKYKSSYRITNNLMIYITDTDMRLSRQLIYKPHTTITKKRIKVIQLLLSANCKWTEDRLPF